MPYTFYRAILKSLILAGDLLWLIVLLAFVVAPMATILKRLGISPLWSLISLIPMVNVIAVNPVAAARWPFGVVEKMSKLWRLYRD